MAVVHLVRLAGVAGGIAQTHIRLGRTRTDS